MVTCGTWPPEYDGVDVGSGIVGRYGGMMKDFRGGESEKVG